MNMIELHAAALLDAIQGALRMLRMGVGLATERDVRDEDSDRIQADAAPYIGKTDRYHRKS